MLALRPNLDRGRRRSAAPGRASAGGQDAAEGPALGFADPSEAWRNTFPDPAPCLARRACGGPRRLARADAVVCEEGMETPGAPGGSRVSLSGGQRRAAAIRPSALATSRHWRRGNSGQLSLPPRPLPARPSPGAAVNAPRGHARVGTASPPAIVRGWPPGPLLLWSWSGLPEGASVFSPARGGGLEGLGVGGSGIERAARLGRSAAGLRGGCARLGEPSGEGRGCLAPRAQCLG